MQAKGAYFILCYMCIKKNFGVGELTVLKEPSFPQTMLTTKAPIKVVEINIVRAEAGRGLHTEKDA